MKTAEEFYCDWYNLTLGDLERGDRDLIIFMKAYAEEATRDIAIRYADAFHNCMSDRDVTGLTAFEVYDRWWNKVKPPI